MKEVLLHCLKQVDRAVVPAAVIVAVQTVRFVIIIEITTQTLATILTASLSRRTAMVLDAQLL